MNNIRVYLSIVILIVGFQKIAFGQDQTALLTNGQLPTSDIPINQQLTLNRNVLLTNPDEQMRIGAANLLLMDSDPNARRILIETLQLTTNIPARTAVCNALIQKISSKEMIPNKRELIQPLLGVFDSQNDEEVLLAAEAIGIFEYSEIGHLLESMTSDAEKPVKTRLNAIYALQRRQQDMEATIKLFRLVDDPNDQISEKATTALNSLGLLTGESRQERDEIIAEIMRKGQDVYIRGQLINQNEKIRLLGDELNSWKNLYLDLLEDFYKIYTDPEIKGDFLVEYLIFPQIEIKNWALEKITEWGQGTNANNLPVDKLEPNLIILISDSEEAIRLKAIDLLSKFGRSDSAKTLFNQLDTEPDEQVKRKLLEALSWVCFRMVDNIPQEMRTKALTLGAQYLSDQDVVKVQIGLQVIKNLLENNGLNPEDTDPLAETYLNLLSQKYTELQAGTNLALRDELLRAMARLVAPQVSDSKAVAEGFFHPIFNEALTDESDTIKYSAVTGLININKYDALEKFRALELYNSQSSQIKTKVIDLAKDVGNDTDLEWLSEKIGVNSESLPAWQAMLAIFDRSTKAEVLNNWMEKLTSPESKLTVEQKITFLEKVQAKANGANMPEMLQTAATKLSDLYYQTKQYEKAGNYLYEQFQSTENSEEKKIILPKLLDCYLKIQNIELTVNLITYSLTQSDLEAEDTILPILQNHLDNLSNVTEKNNLLNALSQIEVPTSSGKWQQHIELWTQIPETAMDNDELSRDEPNDPGI